MADIPPGLPVVTADVGLIERVLTNLLDNAIRHTPRAARSPVVLRPDVEGVAVEVSDIGPGIPGDLRQSLFTCPLFSTSTDLSGGLGLVIVQRILRLHGDREHQANHLQPTCSSRNSRNSACHNCQPQIPHESCMRVSVPLMTLTGSSKRGAA